jgi:hypothetical protein
MKLPIAFTNNVRDGLQQYWTAHLRGLPSSQTMPKNFNEVIGQINNWLVKHTKLVHN